MISYRKESRNVTEQPEQRVRRGKSPWRLIVALGKDYLADRELYLDDGVSLVQAASKNVKLKFTNNTLTAEVTSSYGDGLPLSNVTIAGIKEAPESVCISLGGKTVDSKGVVLLYAADSVFVISPEKVFCKN
ncbi:hypothetical protein BDZ45DRAFT_687370 [Acephala macrosclerotiorum]|nr:hypothetical protein BDZ45DRAFT_687370 [Acephala macrosclerotiorum]